LSLIPVLGKDKKDLPKILDKYETTLEEVEGHLAIEGKLLEHSNREQAGWQAYYDQRRIELHTLVKYLEGDIKRVRGKLFRSFIENHSRDLSDRAIDKYIDSEEAFLRANELYLEVKDLYDRYESVVEAFKSRGYALNNITKIRVASIEDAEI